MSNNPNNKTKAKANSKSANIDIELREWAFFDENGNELCRIYKMQHNRTFVRFKEPTSLSFMKVCTEIPSFEYPSWGEIDFGKTNNELPDVPKTMEIIIAPFENILSDSEKKPLKPYLSNIFVEAPMPGIIPVKYNYGDNPNTTITKDKMKKYNKFDFLIAACTYIFNREKKDEL